MNTANDMTSYVHTINPANDDYITVKFSENNSINSTFLVDTQSDISLIKQSDISNPSTIDTTKKIYIKACIPGIVQTIGVIDAFIIIDDTKIPYRFHVVPSNFLIPTNGIIGKDFLRQYKCNVNYLDEMLYLQFHSKTYKIPFVEDISRGVLTIPPNCEVIRHIPLKLDEPSVILNAEISNGLYTANTISEPNSVYVRVTNINDTPQKLHLSTLSVLPLKNFDVYQNGNDVSNTERSTELLNVLKKCYPEHIESDFAPIIEKYSDIFKLPSDKASTNNFYTQSLNLRDNEPVYLKNYRLPHSQKNEINKQVNQLLANQQIEPTTSSYNSPIILVPKKSEDGNKKYRFCIDYRGVNKKLIPDKFPLPRIDDILDNLGKAKYFSILDLHAGFHQIPIDEKDRHITAFSTDNGAFQWRVLPFGLNIAPNSFSRMMNIAFSGLPMSTCFVYIDDIIIIGRSEKEHIENIISVFDVCRKFNFKLNPDKCKFFRPEVTYLGHRCTDKGLLPGNIKLATICEYPVPHDKDATKRFVAFANFYRRFIQNFATLAQPLNRLTRKNTPFIWDKRCQDAFNTIKKSLSDPKILSYPDFSQPFIITCDASKIGCGAVLSQIQNDIEVPIYFASKSFNKAEQRKAPVEQELIAVHWAVKQFRPYVYGSEFTVRSDCKALVYLYSLKDPSSKLTRMRIDLEEYSFKIVHIPGKHNVVADALSRLSIHELKELSPMDFRSINKVTTRSSTNAQTLNNQSTPDNIQVNDTFIFEILNRNEHKGSPYVHVTRDTDVPQQNASHATMDPGTRKQFVVSLYRKYGSKPFASFKIEEVKDESSLHAFLSKLVEVSGPNDLKCVKISKNECIFNTFNISLFKEMGNDFLKSLYVSKNVSANKKLSIALVQPLQSVPNPQHQKEIIQTFHDDPILGGHPGYRRLLAKIKQNYRWSNMNKQIAKYVSLCHNCQINKPKAKNIEPLRITSTPQRPFDRVVIDTVGPLHRSDEGNAYIVTMMCDLSKYLVAVPVKNKEAKTIAKAIFENLYLIYGHIREILTDCGTEYLNEVLNELTRSLQTRKSHATPYHPQTVGTVERNHRVLNEYLRSYLENEREWEYYLKYYIFCYNTTHHSSFNNKYSPFEIVFGKQAFMPVDYYKSRIDPVYNMENYSKEIKFNFQRIYNLTKDLLNKAKMKTKEIYDKKSKTIELKINDKIMVVDHTRNKHGAIYNGPYSIVSIKGENITFLDRNNKLKTIHKNSIRKYIQ